MPMLTFGIIFEGLSRRAETVVVAPRLFFELAKTTQHDFGSATQRGADYAKGLDLG